MNVIFYVIIFIIGAWAGSFYATAIKRISKGKNIFSIHSYCLNCEKKLCFWEQIPIFSYILLKRKCRHCNKPIDTMHIILETITGALFLITAYSLKLSITSINISNLISFIFIVLYYTYIILVIGTDMKKQKMSSTLLAYGVIISIIYIMYLWLAEAITIYISTIYLIIMVLLLLLNIVNTKKKAQSSYIIDLLTMILIMIIFTGEATSILMISATLFGVAAYILINKIKSRSKRNKNKVGLNIKMASIMGILNIIIFLVLINIK